MDFQINEIAMTLAVGGFTILSIEAVMHCLLGKPKSFVFGNFNYLRRRLPENVTDRIKINIFVFLAISFGLGLIAENLSYKYVDKVEGAVKWLPFYIRLFLPREIENHQSEVSTFDSRIETLISNLDGRASVNGLAEDLARQHEFSSIRREKGELLEAWILDPDIHLHGPVLRWKETPDGPSLKRGREVRRHEINGPEPAFLPDDDIVDLINMLYYRAKNRVYLVPNYYDEMRKIESRRDFSRSIAMISYIFLILLIGGIALVFVLSILGKLSEWTSAKFEYLQYARMIAVKAFECLHRKTKIRFDEPIRQVFAATKDKGFIVTFRSLSTLAVFAIICLAALWAFEREMEEFHKRVFGYYSTLRIEQINNSEDPDPPRIR